MTAPFLRRLVTRGLFPAKVAPDPDAQAEARFETDTDANLYRGVFDTWEAAAASAPGSRPLGYDNPESAALYLRLLGVGDWDYPAMFWISDAVHGGTRRFADLGGSVGIKYFAFRKFVKFPPDLRWRVIDVPAAVARGREFAAARGASDTLEFTDRIDDIDDIELLFASGVLQYLPETLPEVLRRHPLRPRRVVINTAAFHDGPDFFTLNSVGTAFCPYRVQNTEAFVAAMTALGYRLRDQWRNLDKPMRIPFHPERSLDSYTGFCFDAAQA